MKNKVIVNILSSISSGVLLLMLLAAPVLAAAAANSINSAAIIDGQVKTADLAAGAVGPKKLKTGAVNSAKIADGAVASVDLANSAVNSAKIADGAVQTADLANGAVTDSKLSFSTKTRYLSLPSSAFIPSEQYDHSIKNISSGASVENYLYLKTGTSWTYFRAPVNLPDGAKIIALTYTGYDNEASAINNIRLKRISSATSVQTEMEAVELSDAAAWQRLTETAILNPVVDNANFSYVVQANMNASAVENHRLGSALITYEIAAP